MVRCYSIFKTKENYWLNGHGDRIILPDLEEED